MSDQKLPIVSFKNLIEKQQIAHRMFNHRRRLLQLELKRPKQSSNEAANLSYKTILEQNPKRTYLLQNKYTEIQRQNRLLFEKISKISKNKKKSPKTIERMRSLNVTFRKKQIEEIQNENVKLYNRLLKQKAFISFKEVDKEFLQTKKMSGRLSNKNKYQFEDWY